MINQQKYLEGGNKMAKKIFYDDDARARVLGGAKVLYDAVRVTYGPKGRNVAIGRSFGGPDVTHDGVTVAEAVDLPDTDDETLGYRTGAELIKQAAKNLNKIAGDGTTTVTVLTYQILKEANRLIAAGHNPMELRRGIEQAGAEVVEQIRKLSEEFDEKDPRVEQVATISAGDAVIGKLIAEVMAAIGKDGVVAVEPGQGLETESEVVEGYTFERGYVSPYFVNVDPTQETVFDNPLILVSNKTIVDPQDFTQLMERIHAQGNRNLVIIAEQVDTVMLNILVVNKLKGSFNSVVVNAPSFGDRRKEIMKDIAVLTDGQVVNDEEGIKFETIDLAMLGTAQKVIVGKDSTTIIQAAGGEDAVQKRVDLIKEQINIMEPDEWERKELEKRAAALAGKVAIIRVGGASETEIDEKKYRIDDAVAASKAALAEGIVPGGGVTLVNIAKGIAADGSDSIAAGRQVVKNALRQPFLQIMANAGLNAEALLERVEGLAAEVGLGIDVNNPQSGLIDVKKAGVVDPTRVTREAVQNSISIAATASTMGALVVEIPEPDKGPQQDQGY